MTAVKAAPRTGRARPLSPEDRRAMILDVTVPLLLEHGNAVTTKQIAENAGVAEGTVFRAFGDKETLIDAAVDRFLDPEPLRVMLRAVDLELPLRDRVHDVLFHLQARTTGLMGLMAALHPRQPPRRGSTDELVDLVVTVLAPDAAHLRVDPRTIAFYLRLLAFASSVPAFNDPHPFTIDQLTDFVMDGIRGTDGIGGTDGIRGMDEIRGTDGIGDKDTPC
jgi:AcrR family transcriptional regulator